MRETENENVTDSLDVLKTMSSDELEDYRAAGEDCRELSHAIRKI
ncbi:conjugation system SOS inhibitor PsiB family protein [Klebsiella pneumoniae]